MIEIDISIKCKLSKRFSEQLIFVSQKTEKCFTEKMLKVMQKSKMSHWGHFTH